MTPPQYSVRYERLLQVAEKAMLQSRSKFDIERAIREFYGDDASLFVDGNNNEEKKDDNVLHTVLKSMLDRIHEGVKDDFASSMKDKNVEAQLLKLEQKIFRIEHAAAMERSADEKDKALAQEALSSTILPDGVSPRDVVSYQQYQKMLAEKAALEEQIVAVEAAVEQLEDQKRQRSSAVDSRLETMKVAERALEKSADICSMVP